MFTILFFLKKFPLSFIKSKQIGTSKVLFYLALPVYVLGQSEKGLTINILVKVYRYNMNETKLWFSDDPQILRFLIKMIKDFNKTLRERKLYQSRKMIVTLLVVDIILKNLVGTLRTSDASEGGWHPCGTVGSGRCSEQELSLAGSRETLTVLVEVVEGLSPISHSVLASLLQV